MDPATDYRRVAVQVFELLNQLRREPNLFVAELAAMRKFYNGNAYRNPALEYSVWTEEGVEALEEAIGFLKSVPPAPALERDPQLDAAAQLLVERSGPEGLTTHGEGDFAFERRLALAQREASHIAENISFGWDNPKEIVLQLVVDDGEPKRDNRANIFSPRFTAVGVAAGPHKVYAHFCVLDFFGRKAASELRLSRFELDRSEWPENAVAVQKHLERVAHDGKSFTRLVYEFTLANGDKVTRKREMAEAAEQG